MPLYDNIVENFADFFKIFTYAFRDDPISLKRAQKTFDGIAVSQPDAVPDIRGDGSFWGGGRGMLRLRDSNDFIDLSSVTNRQSRYKEYERLRYVPEIETSLNIFADEACVSENTKIATPFGFISIKDLAEKYKPEERFLVYCYDINKQDYTLGWAFHPRKVKTAETVTVFLDNGSSLIATPDHKVLLRYGGWVEAGNLKYGDELMPFYRLPANQFQTKLKHNQFPRIFTFKEGWMHERQFVDVWKSDGKTKKYAPTLNKIIRHVSAGLNAGELFTTVRRRLGTIRKSLNKEGFSIEELRFLGKRYEDKRIVNGVSEYKQIDVYDLSVDEYHNFATDSLIVHNCQKGDNNHTFEIITKHKEVKKELELLFHKILKIDKKIWNYARNLFLFGDMFLELCIDPENPKEGVYRLKPLPPDSIYRIETTKGKLIEFQQSKEGPDYQSLARTEVTKATDAELAQATALRFPPEEISHWRIGDDRRTFYPYGVSLVEAARGPAHQLRLMEDAMVVYRLVRAPERRVFYIDVGGLTPAKAEAFIERMKDALRKKKLYSNKSAIPTGASAVEERWHAPSQDEDFWIPIRPNVNTRVETLPGACLALDTKIPLLDGRTLSLQEIINEFEIGKTNWAYSCNPETGEPTPGLISWAGITRKNTDVVKITFDNGESLVCTPDHKFPVIGKGKVEAKDLSIGESLIAFNVRKHILRSNRKDEYLQIYNTYFKKWVFVHRLIAEYVKNTKYEVKMLFNENNQSLPKNTVHHRNFDKYDNSPENLAWMSWKDHVCYHASMPRNNSQKISKGVKKYHDNLSKEKKIERDKILKERSKKGSKTFLDKLKNPEFNSYFRQQQLLGWQKAKIDRAELHRKRGEEITRRNYEYWSNPSNKKKVFAKQTIIYPQSIFDFVVAGLKSGESITQIVEKINQNIELVKVLEAANQHIKRENVSFKNMTLENVNKMAKAYGFKTSRHLIKSIGVKEQKPGRPKLVWPKKVMDEFVALLKEDKEVNEALEIISSNKDLTKALRSTGHEVGEKGFTMGMLYKMLRSFGYRNIRHLKQDVTAYNHRVVSVEYLIEKIDTGTLTIDGNEELNNYHTFAVSTCGIYTYNSNLGETDDAVFFRQKLLTALGMPRNYLNQEDPQITKLSVSAQDVRFAKLIERLQMSISDGLLEIAERHLILKGFPEEWWDDLDFVMTPPSEYREISRQEVLQLRYNNASTLKSSQLMADYDIYVEILKVQPDKAKELVDRNKMQKLEDMKITLMGQNPELIGLGQPGQNELEMGGQAGGPSPMLGSEQPQTTQQIAQQPQTAGPGGAQPPAETQPLAEPTDEELKRYDLEIKDYSKEKDEEEIDASELEGELT